MRECFSEVENVIIMLDKFREALETAFDERLYGNDLAAMLFDFGTNDYLETVFDKIHNGDEVAIERLSAAQQTELLLQIQNFLTIR